MEKTEAKSRKSKSRKSPGRINRRDQIVSATEKLIRSQGLSGVTTRQIAEAVGCSEGALYVHFEGRVELLLAVLEESLPDMLQPLHALTAAVGQNTPQQNLQTAVGGILAFHRRVIPMLASLFAEPELLASYQKSLARNDGGPHRAIARIADYMRSEQALGRIGRDVDANMAAILLMSASFFRIFSERFFGQPMTPPLDQFVKQLVASITAL